MSLDELSEWAAYFSIQYDEQQAQEKSAKQEYKGNRQSI